MSKKKETEPKNCIICNKEFNRRRWKNRYEDLSRYEDRDICDDPNCYREKQSLIMKRVHADKKIKNRSIVDIFLSKKWVLLNSVRFANAKNKKQSNN